MNPQYVCSERAKLWERYQIAFESYIEAITVLDAARSGPRFEEAVSDARRARRAFEELWDNYCRHVLTHQCHSEEVPSLFTPSGALAASAGAHRF